MGIFDWIGGWFSGSASTSSESRHTETNPATGLPMAGPGMGGVDVAGNPYGSDRHRWDDPHTPSALPDSLTGPSPSDWDNWSSTTGTGPDHFSHDPWRDY